MRFYRPGRVISILLVLVLCRIIIIRIITLAPPKIRNKLGVWNKVLRLTAEKEVIPLHL
jgi:hypothetical protein